MAKPPREPHFRWISDLNQSWKIFYCTCGSEISVHDYPMTMRRIARGGNRFEPCNCGRKIDLVTGEIEG